MSGVNPSTLVYSGENSLRLFSTWLPSQTANGAGKTIVIVPNRSYLVAGYFNIVMLYKARAQLYVDFYNATGQHIGSNITEDSVVDGQYRFISNSGITPKEAMFASIYVIVRSTGDDGAGLMFVDSIKFQYQ